jgi:hypothetical protein
MWHHPNDATEMGLFIASGLKKPYGFPSLVFGNAGGWVTWAFVGAM